MKKIIYNLIVIYFTIWHQVSLAQYDSKTFNWNMDAYEKHTFTNSTGSMPYRLLKPPHNDLTKKYPLTIMLHGEGEGIGQPCTNQHGLNVCNLLWGGKMHLDSINKYPSFVVFPQTHGGDCKSDIYLNLLRGTLEYLFKTYNIDLNRIYIHGLSGGGNGVYNMI